MSTVEVLLPRPAAWDAEQTGMSRKLFSVAGKTVAVVNNGWGSFDDLSKVFERILRDEYGVAEVLHYLNNRHAESAESSFGAPEWFLDEIAEKADAALSGLGNCGSCTAWSCETSVALEQRGVHSAALVTELFQTLAEFNVERTNKAPGHPIVVFEENFEYTDPEALEAQARQALRTLFGPGIGVTV
jgi:hypothetical protein